MRHFLGRASECPPDEKHLAAGVRASEKAVLPRLMP